MNRVIVNIVFIFLFSLVIFPVKEGIDLLLSNINSQTANTKDDDDDEDVDTAVDFAKKIDVKLKFEIPVTDNLVIQPKEIITTQYFDFGILLPLNHAAEVQTPPPNC